MSQAVLESLRRLQKKQAPNGPRAGISRPAPSSTSRKENGSQRPRENASGGATREAIFSSLREAIRRVSQAWSPEVEARLDGRDRADLVEAEARLNRAWTAGRFEEAARAVTAWERLWLDVIQREGR